MDASEIEAAKERYRLLAVWWKIRQQAINETDPDKKRELLKRAESLKALVLQIERD